MFNPELLSCFKNLLTVTVLSSTQQIYTSQSMSLIIQCPFQEILTIAYKFQYLYYFTWYTQKSIVESFKMVFPPILYLYQESAFLWTKNYLTLRSLLFKKIVFFKFHLTFLFSNSNTSSNLSSNSNFAHLKLQALVEIFDQRLRVYDTKLVRFFFPIIQILPFR